MRQGAPGAATEMMVAYVYDYIGRRNPVGFFGMVHVLEGTSAALACHAAAAIERALDLSDLRRFAIFALTAKSTRATCSSSPIS